MLALAELRISLELIRKKDHQRVGRIDRSKRDIFSCLPSFLIGHRMTGANRQHGSDLAEPGCLPDSLQRIPRRNGGTTMDMHHDISSALQAYLCHPARTGHLANAIRDHLILQFDRLNYRIEVSCNLWD